MSNKRNFFSDFLIIGTGTIINIVLGIFTTPIITHIVDPDEYGKLSIFQMYTSIALMILCLGLDQSLVRFFYMRDELKYKKALLHNCIKMPIIVAFCVFILILISLIFDLFKYEFPSIIMVLLCINVFISIINRIAILLLRLTYQSKKFSICNILTKTTYVISALILIFSFNSDYFLLLALATIISNLIPTLFAILSTKEYWGINRDYKLDNKKEVLKYGMPLIISMGITTVFQAIDKISLNHFCSYTEVGVYASAMSLVNIFAIVQSTFNSLWGPMQVEHYTKHPEDNGYIQKANQMITVVMFGLGITLILVKDVFALLLGEKFREAAYIMPFLIFNPIMLTVSETTSAGIGYSKKSYLNIWVAVGACVTNIIGNTILVPIYECKGAAISTGISYFVFWLLRMFFSNKYYYIDYKLPKFFLMTLLTTIYAFYNTFFAFSWLSIVCWLLLVVAFTLLYRTTIAELMAMVIRFVKGTKKSNE